MNKLDRKLDLYLKNNLNILLEGEAGWGKTEMVKQCFNRSGLKWRYFSAATMDPWVDFIGVPKEVVGDDGVSYLELIKPKDFAHDEVEAIFFDEFNRANLKVRNAVMELIQFKSINGRKFNNLRVVWGAINPYDDDEIYNVEQLDPAQEDRFHVKMPIPSKPNVEFFTENYGEKTAQIIIEWWDAQTKEAQKKISGRRLQYVLDFYNNKGDIRDMLPKEANVNRLIVELSSGSIIEAFRDLLVKNVEEDLKKFLKNDNNYTVAVDYANNKDPKVFDVIISSINDERLVTLLTEYEEAIPILLQKDDISKYFTVLHNVGMSGRLSKEYKMMVNAALRTRFTEINSSKGIEIYNSPTLTTLNEIEFSNELMAYTRASKNYGFDQSSKNNCYSFLLDNLNPVIMQKLTTMNYLHLISLCFRVIECSEEMTLMSTYAKILPMLNVGLQHFITPDGGNLFNEKSILSSFTNKKRITSINKLARVQGFLDSNLNQLLFKPRLV